MRKVSAVHEAIAGDDIYQMHDGEPVFIGVKIDKIRAALKSSKQFNRYFALSLDAKHGEYHMSKPEAAKCFGLQAAQ